MRQDLLITAPCLGSPPMRQSERQTIPVDAAPFYRGKQVVL